MKFWTDSWNPVVGCSPASPGCDNCYAARQAHGMHRRNPKCTKYTGLTEVVEVTPPQSPPVSRPQYNGIIRTMSPDAKIWTQPERWRKPRTIFVCNMSDLFHPGVEFNTIARVFDAFVRAPQHLYLVLTKRPRIADRFMHVIMCGDVGSLGCRKELRVHEQFRNVWFGVTAEDEERAAERIPYLRGLSRFFGGTFISYEPALSPVVWERHLVPGNNCPNWIVAGGESGLHARPCHPDWIRACRDFCAGPEGVRYLNAAKVEFTFKQWGRWWPMAVRGSSADVWDSDKIPLNSDGTDCRGVESLVDDDTVLMRSVGKRAAGHELDGKVHEWLPTPEEVLR